MGQAPWKGLQWLQGSPQLRHQGAGAVPSLLLWLIHVLNWDSNLSLLQKKGTPTHYGELLKGLRAGDITCSYTHV